MTPKLPDFHSQFKPNSPILPLPNRGNFGLSDADRGDTSPIDAALEASNYALWRAQVAGRLMDAGRHSESLNFADCGTLFGNFNVAACDADPGHEVRALPFTCHLRYCPDCERRHAAELVAKYTPVLKDLSENSDRAGWSLKKIELTTPYSLEADDAEQLYQDAWEFFERWQQLLFQRILADEMTPAEKRRGRLDYAKHGIGSLASAEFGEHGHKLHFHILAFCPWIDKRLSSDIWREASDGQADITYLRRIDYHDVDDAVREQVKYVTKFTELPPALVIKLADVLDGSRRLRTYGMVRKAEKLEREPCQCATCSAIIRVMKVQEYFEICLQRNIAIDPVILAAGRKVLLDLKPGNKSGEVESTHLPRNDPDPPPKQADLPYFDAIAPKKTRFRYD